MGRILAPYGVRGWLKVQPQTEAIEGLLNYSPWWLQGEHDWQAYRLVEGRVQGAGLVVHLEGIADRDQAAVLRGASIAVARSALPAADEGEFYWCDLIGLAVVNREGVALGEVAEVFATGANDVLVVRGERERLIPFAGPVVMQVDLDRARLLVDWGADY
ncbi:MAG: ribosome maturation factor RimM [Burkholderiales bacterium]|nr:ribosome maturation factor RimM [Burkholderiales bacterium]